MGAFDKEANNPEGDAAVGGAGGDVFASGVEAVA
jgi:hypothetical protein